jgi:hypothetical protein
VAAYPQFLASAGANELIWKDGTRMVYDDGKAKDFETLLENADLQDQMSLPYPVGRDYPIPPDQDPGRFRNTDFFKKMYGANAQEVKSKLVPVVWLPKSANLKLQFSSVNGANKRLEAVSAAIDALPPALKACALKSAGTFAWRVISGQNQLSAHSFGVAIDLDVAYSQYWRWDLPKMHYNNRIPIEIVEIFEQNGFIWGGKWKHYDTMHFEYRPELLPPLADK